MAIIRTTILSIVAASGALAVACGGSAPTPPSSAPAGSGATSPAGVSASASQTAKAGVSGAPSATPSPIAVQELPSACTLASPAQLAAVLGATPDAGKPRDFEPTYKTCGWNVVPTGATNASAITIGAVIKKKPTDQGFGAPSQLGAATKIDGLGDVANFYSNGDAAAFRQGQVNVNKGAYSISIVVNFGTTAPNDATLKTSLSELARQVLGNLGA